MASVMSKKGLAMLCILMCTACSLQEKKVAEEKMEVDTAAVRELQGLWLDDNTELPLFRIKGDSIYYASQVNVPMPFTVMNDTLMVFSVDTLLYPIKERGLYSLEYKSLTGDVIAVHKAETDTVSFGLPVVEEKSADEVIEKDSVIMYKGERFRGYAYINPTRKKVIRLGMSEEGLPIENVYYDNIIHICIYKGRERLFARDIDKEMFAQVVPMDFLKLSILSDMDFLSVNEEGYWYLATICEPEGASCYNVKMNVTREGEVRYMVQ